MTSILNLPANFYYTVENGKYVLFHNGERLNVFDEFSEMVETANAVAENE